MNIPLVAWSSSARYGWGAWHRVAGARTECGIRIPAGARISRKTVEATRLPADTCASCWPTIDAGEASRRWARWILTAFARSLHDQGQRMPLASDGGALAGALEQLARQVQADAAAGQVDVVALLRLGAEQYVIARYVRSRARQIA
jgi:hypothetical protein